MKMFYALEEEIGLQKMEESFRFMNIETYNFALFK